MHFEIRRVHPPDQESLIQHSERQSAESGQFGQPIFMPFANPPDYRHPEQMARQLSAWQKEVGQNGWLADWVALSEGAFVANLSLRGGKIEAEQHRAQLSLGVERAHQEQGIASQLIEQAIAFASDHQLAWLDLRVFEKNDRAIALYRKFGFTELGRIPDCFRVGELSITDIFMALELKHGDQ
jgi:ribosomal protein S18 acetylase RimI-like enzyme